MQEITEKTVGAFTPTANNSAGSRILMAEDNLVNQKLAKLLFRKLNHNVDIVSNGREAVEAVVSGAYDLVFMDIQMPQLDGVAASQEIKKVMGEEAPVIIALTANAMQGDKEKYLEAGMDHYIPKPISMKDLSNYIEQYVVS
ncbi:response regulator [Owenweeksia hongkongensis]|uniref:response regulator n=1 Tax=Owenweeksia hongkongensis TaxID=253245 RepID=UPI003A955085